MRPAALPFGAALAWVLVAGLSSQLVGVFTSTWASAGHPTDGPAAIVPALVGSAATLLLVVFLAPSLAGVPLRSALGLRAAPPDVFVAAAVGTIMLGPTGDASMSLAAELFPTFTLGSVTTLHEAAATVPLALAWPAFALLPGVSEELLFRGLLQRAARRGARAIAVSGVLFALFHVDPHHVVGVLPLGLFLAWVGERAGVWVTAAAHVANNTAAVLVAHSHTLDVGYGTPHELPWTWWAASLLLFAVAARHVARRTRAPTTTAVPPAAPAPQAPPARRAPPEPQAPPAQQA